MANEKNIEFVKTTSSKLDDVLEMENGRFQKSFIHTHDESENHTVDDQLYIGEDRITDNFNIGNLDPGTRTRSLGGLAVSTIGQLKEKTISQILIDILSDPVIPVTGVSLNKNSSTMRVGGSSGTLSLTATVSPSNASNKTVTWSSSDTSVTTVNGSGTVTAVGLGTAIITATASGKTATCEITVEATPVSGVSLSQSSLSFNSPTASQTLTATVSPSTATDKSVTWSSSNTNVVTVNSSGKVSVVGVGNATITATASGKTATCSVSVTAIVPTRKTSPSSSISYNGNTFIGSGDSLPDPQNDITVTTNRGTWNNYSGYYAGEPEPIVWTMSPNPWPQTASEGTYTIYGQVTFQDGVVPVDNFGASHSENQYKSGTVTTNTITITAVNPIYINGYLTDSGDDNEGITHMRKYVVDYRENVTLYITIPSETYSNKMCIYLKGTYTTFEVLQFDKFADSEDKYIIPIDMVASPETNPTYDGYTKYVRSDSSYTNTAPAQYKITFRK